MATVTKSNAQNISSPNGNSLAVFIDLNGVLTLKDIYGVTQEVTAFITSGVSSFSAVKGTFISMTNNTNATGVINMGTINLSATGTPDSSNFLRGDNTWDVPVGTQYSAGSGLSLSGTEFSNSAPDQTVSLSEGDNITITGTYPNFTIASGAPGGVTSITATTPILASSSTEAVNISIPSASGASDGYLTSPDWTTFNSKTTNTGTVTSVGLIGTGIAAFAITGSPITTSGTLNIAPTGGTAGQFLQQDGNWATVPMPAANTGLPTITTDAFVGDGTTSAYTLTVTPHNINYTMAFVSGVYQQKATYLLAGNVVTFSAAVSNGLGIEVVSTTAAAAILGWNANSSTWETETTQWQNA
jgi:hypothetical protein